MPTREDGSPTNSQHSTAKPAAGRASHRILPKKIVVVVVVVLVVVIVVVVLVVVVVVAVLVVIVVLFFSAKVFLRVLCAWALFFLWAQSLFCSLTQPRDQPHTTKGY